MATIKDVKDKIIDYLYNVDIDKLTISEINGLSNITMILKSVSDIREDGEDPFAKALTSIYDRSVTSLNGSQRDETILDVGKVGE